MTSRSKRSLKVLPELIERVKAARNALPQKDDVLAGLWGMSRSTLQKFLAGNPVGSDNFLKACSELNLDWQEIAGLSKLKSLKSTEIDDTVLVSKLEPSRLNPNFVGREEAIAELKNITDRGSKVVLIWAGGGVGKTTLARQFLKQEFGASVVEFAIAKETQNITSIESLVEEKLRQLGEEPGREFGISLERLKQKLKFEKIGVLIDNLEPALDDGKFIEPHRRYVDLISTLGDLSLQSVTIITSRERLRESSLTIQTYKLKGLDKQAWQVFFENKEIAIDDESLTGMHSAYGGNAKAMESLSGEIITDFDKDMLMYWRKHRTDLLVHRDLADLISNQFNRLKKRDPNAYKLLCRLGCFRYQDVPTVPNEGLTALLWDVEEGKLRVIESLRDRSLIEFSKGEYYLHPAIRAEAVSLLRQNGEWEETNQRIAEFWTESIKTVDSIDDALRAFESYYHYIEINDFTKAGAIIVRRRKNKWGQGLILGDSFHRLGLLDQILTSTNQILSKLEKFRDLKSRYIMNYLHNVKGNACWAKGDIKQAIECHEIAKKSIEENDFSSLYNTDEGLNWILKDIMVWMYVRDVSPSAYLGNPEKNRYAYSLMRIGVCKTALWDMEGAVDLLESAVKLSCDIKADTLLAKTRSCLAFAMSSLNFNQESNDIASQAYAALTVDKYTTIGGFAMYLHFIAKTYKNLDKLQMSFEVYNQILNILKTDNSDYRQGIANSLTGMAEIYRMQKDFTKALSHHSESIEILDKIGAKCDLAEAYFQFGLTYQAMNEVEQSIVYRDKALKLFTEMEAPKQIERISKAFG